MSVRMIATRVGDLSIRTAGEGPPVVLWHSLFVDHRSWDQFAGPLTADRYVIRIDGPSHGQSAPRTRRFTMVDCAVAATEILGSLGIDQRRPVDWVGNAWGGHVGALVATRHPELVRSLVLLGTPIHAYTSAERRRTQLLVALYRLMGARRFIVSAAIEVLLSERSRQEMPAATAYVEECLRAADRAGLVNAIRSISLDREDVSPLLPGIQVPTLVVTSPGHPGFTPAQAEEAVRLLRHGELTIVDGPSYLTPLEAPDETRGVVCAFWARRGESSAA